MKQAARHALTYLKMNYKFIKMFRLIFLAFILLSAQNSRAQSNAEIFANKIAEKMKDSLSLTETEQAQLYDINMLLHQQKNIAREQYAENDSLGIYIQRVENTRDSLYELILPSDKFILYQQKKTTLINNN